ncbi:hypothetical protein M1N79_04700 [Dehalococcoidia bacterium]|nr:hypothetical protein [Dehalococcoidia bacterium]
MITSTSPWFNPEEFFGFAGSIVRDSSAKEAALRSAISRAYYSVYLVARDRLFGMDETQLTANIRKRISEKSQQRHRRRRWRELGTHERVIFAIQDKTNNVTLSQQLDQLREARVNADYRMNQNCLSNLGKQSWRELAEETMQLATLILPLAKRLPSY